MKRILLTIALLTVSSSLMAQSVRYLDFTQTNFERADTSFSSSDDDFNTIGQIKVTELETEVFSNDQKLEKGLGEIITTADNLLALGKKVWSIVEAGRPVNQSSFATPISVIPNTERSEQAFYEMENWSTPKVKKFKVDYTNLLGMTVVSFTYGVYYQHSGTYRGKGQYLTGINIDATDVSVAWGFDFNASSQLVSISNMGSQDNPNAAATIKINYRAKSPLKDIKSSESFHITGKGQLIPVR